MYIYIYNVRMALLTVDTYIYKRDRRHTKERWISVDNRQSLAKHVNIRVYFDTEYLMISEVQLQNS